MAYHFPEQLSKKLMNMNTGDWRTLRAQVRWAYERGNYKAPGLLSSFMEELPEDSQDWINYAKGIAHRRRLDRVAKLRAKARARDKKAKAMHRDYQKYYMREYRQGLRRRAK